MEMTFTEEEQRPMKQVAILASGLNSRLLPLSKAIPKALLPLQGVPAIHYLVEEARMAGAERIVIVVRGSNSLIEHYFSPDEELRKELTARGKKDALEILDRVEGLGSQLRFVRQASPLGEAHAFSLALKEFDPSEGAGVIFGDVLYPNHIPVLQRLSWCIHHHSKHVFVTTGGRIGVPPRAFAKIQNTTFSYEKNFDSTIIDLFDRNDVFLVPSGKQKIKLGTFDEYRSSFCDMPNLLDPPHLFDDTSLVKRHSQGSREEDPL